MLKTVNKAGRVNRRVALVGAGFIASVHGEAVGLIEGVEVTAIVDPRADAAKRLAVRFGAEHVYCSVDEAIAEAEFDVAHVLVPPHLHAKVARPLLEAGIDVLLEKPMATSSEDCDEMLRLARKSGASIGVNQNFIFDRAFRKMLNEIESGRVGNLRSVTCIYSMPLRQLSAGQLGHWMFREPKNLLLEQAVHPLSQIVRLIGSVREANVTASDAKTITPDTTFAPWLMAHLKGSRGTAQFEFRMGAEFPTWQIIATCDDATLTADVISGTMTLLNRTRWLEPVDRFFGGLQIARHQIISAASGLATYCLAMAKLRPRSDSFFRSIRGATGAFYEWLDEGGAFELEGSFGSDIVGLCELLTAKAHWPTACSVEIPLTHEGRYDVLVIGGTGFIGKHVVNKILQSGRRVGVMARSITGLGELYYSPNVVVVQGDISNSTDLEGAISRTPVVINLAHGGGGETWEEISEAMVGGAKRVAEACIKCDVGQLINIGSIAGLNLGNGSETITSNTPPDNQSRDRADYARAKAEVDKLLLELCRTRSLPLTIIRPGVVVGQGGAAFHTGIGFFNNEQHFLGWNMGKNPLPFVLVDDVADAVVNCIGRDGVVGKTYNLVGDVRWSSRRYVEELGASLGRPLKFHPQPTTVLFLVEYTKWIIKRLAGKKQPAPTMYDLRSRSLLAKFDCQIEKRELDWQPEASEEGFRRRAIGVHGEIEARDSGD